MATKLPRFQITVNPENIDLLKDVYKYLGMTKSKLFNDLIDQIKPSLEVQINALKKIEELRENNDLDKFDLDKYMNDTLEPATKLIDQANNLFDDLKKNLKDK